MIREMLEQMVDYEIEIVRQYIRGENKRGRSTRLDEENARSALESLVKRACDIRETGIELGSINWGMYSREKKRRAGGRWNWEAGEE